MLYILYYNSVISQILLKLKLTRVRSLAASCYKQLSKAFLAVELIGLAYKQQCLCVFLKLIIYSI